MENLAAANTLILDEPTNHLGLESLTAQNKAVIAFPEVLPLVSCNHELLSTVANGWWRSPPTG